MQIRLFKTTALLLLILAGYFASASDNSRIKEAISSKKLASGNESLQKNPNFPFNYEFTIVNAPVQIVNVQSHRTVHFNQVIHNKPNTYTISIKCFNAIGRQTNCGLSRFRKLILFPFHAFC